MHVQADYKKPTAILTNIPDLVQLHRRCDGQHVHEQLRGSETRRVDGKYVSQTRISFAGEYPKELCTTWADLVAKFLHPRHDPISTSQFKGLSYAFNSALVEAAGQSCRQAAKAARCAIRSSHNLEDSSAIPEARQFIRDHPVLFGQHTNQDAREIQDRFQPEVAI